MEIKNEMESAVKSLREARKPRADRGWIARLLGGRAEKRGGCDCALCELDVLACALNTLPPRYCLANHYGLSQGRIDTAATRKALERAVIKVSRHQKHKVSSPERDAGALRLRNFALEEASATLDALSGRLKNCCLCEQCRADILAYALNRFPPKYGVELRGAVLMPPHQREFLQHELRQVLEQAARFVSANPRHPAGEG